MKEKKKTKGVLPFSLGSAANTVSYVMVSNLTYCLTNSAGMTAAVVGMIFLISRLFDGVTDIIAGFIIDHTNTKWGKARPFDLVAIPMWIFIIFSFSVPNISNIGKIVWVFLTYNLSQSVCYTLVMGANAVRVKRSFAEEDRVSAISVASFISMIFSLVVATLFPILVQIFQFQSHGWTIIASVIAVPAIIASLLQFFFLKELDGDYEEENVQAADNVNFVEGIKLLFKNPYVFVSGLAFMMISINNGTTSVSNNYCQYVLGNISLGSVISLLSIVGMACVLVMPLLTNKLGTKRMVMLGFALIAVFQLAKLVRPYSVIWLAICSIFASAGAVFVSGMKNIINIECMNYGKKKTGVEIEGLYSSVNCFVDKIGLGLGSFLLGIILQLGHYDGTQLTQTASAIFSIKFAYAVLPAICGLIGFVVMHFYNEKKVKVAAE